MKHLKENLIILILLATICLGAVYSTEVIDLLEGLGRGFSVLYNIKNIEPTESKLAEDNRPVSVISSEEVVQQEDITPDSATNNTSNPAFSSVAEIKDYIQTKAEGYGVDPELALAIAEAESDFRNICCYKGCEFGEGIYQFEPITWEEQCEGEVDNIQDNIDCAIKLFSRDEYWRWKNSEHEWGNYKPSWIEI